MSAQSSSAPTGAERDFVIERTFEASPELVWKTWTQPKHMAQWWGPATFANTVCELEVRPGGAYRIVMRGPDGVDYPIKGVFREVTPPMRLVLTMDCSEHPASWHDMVNPARGSDANPAGEMLTTVTFDRKGTTTKLTIRTRFASVAIRDAMVKMGMNEGWSQSLERLGDVLGALAI